MYIVPVPSWPPEKNKPYAAELELELPYQVLYMQSEAQLIINPQNQIFVHFNLLYSKSSQWSNDIISNMPGI